MSYRKTIAIDFDGVLHSYTGEWEGAHVANDPPTEGMATWITELAEHCDLIIYSARLNGEGGFECVRKYLLQHGVDEAVVDKIQLIAKPHAQLYIDDRAFHFQGTFPSVEEIQGFKPWNRKNRP